MKDGDSETVGYDFKVTLNYFKILFVIVKDNGKINIITEHNCKDEISSRDQRSSYPTIYRKEVSTDEMRLWMGYK